ncbi:MAG: hypothetical protein JXQ76_11005 [Campylobacterales bacterium]|nr:hypothetical protein [Campylobacterales bacterium]
MHSNKTILLTLAMSGMLLASDVNFDFGEADGSGSARPVILIEHNLTIHSISIQDIDTKGLRIHIKDTYDVPNYLIHKNAQGKTLHTLESNIAPDIAFASIAKSQFNVGDTIEIITKRLKEKIVKITITQ